MMTTYQPKTDCPYHWSRSSKFSALWHFSSLLVHDANLIRVIYLTRIKLNLGLY